MRGCGTRWRGIAAPKSVADARSPREQPQAVLRVRRRFFGDEAIAHGEQGGQSQLHDKEWRHTGLHLAKVLQNVRPLEKNPELVNTDPYGEGWMVKISVSNAADVDALMGAEAYGELVG